MPQYNVNFYNAQNNNLHVSALVDVENAADAVKAAIESVADTVGHDVASFRASVTDANGEGVPNIDGAASKASLAAQVAALQQQIAQLNDDGSTDEQNKQVVQSVSNVDRTPTPPPVATPSFTGPDPSQSQVDAGTPVTAADAPRISPPASQADIDRAISQQQSPS